MGERTGERITQAGRPSRARTGVRLAGAVLALSLAAIVLTRCGGSGAHATSVAHKSRDRSAAGASTTRATASFADVTLSVPAGNGGGTLQTPRTLRLPVGWTAEVWARVPGARYALWTPEHDLLVTASERGDLYELTPGQDPASPPTQRVLLSGLNEPEGMAFDVLDGRRVLYLAQADQIDRFAWLPGGQLGERKVIVANLPDKGPPGEDTHRLKSVAIGPDHKIYFSIGSVSNAKVPSAAERRSATPRASIMSIASDGKDMQVVMRGVRNGEGLAFAPNGSLWTAVNNRDEIPYPFHRSYAGQAQAFGKVIRAYVNEHPPDELAKVTAQGNLGWPYCNPDPDDQPGEPEKGLHYANLRFVPDAVTNPGERLLDCKRLAPLQRGLPAHSAPLGLTFLRGSAIGSPWSGGAALAVHGSWDRTPPRAPAVLWLPWTGSTLGTPVTLVSGFQEASGSRWGRPVDAVAGPEGDLYVTDDLAGAIYRLGPHGG